MSGAAQLVGQGWVAAPVSGADAGQLTREHARLFPGGFTLRVGQRAPRAFAALPPDVRQAIWREAIRRATGARRRSSPVLAQWRVTALAPDGRLTRVFVAPRTEARAAAPDGGGSEADRDWTRSLQQSAWRVLAG